MSEFSFPARFADLKQEIAASYPHFEKHATQAWVEILGELKTANAEIAKSGSNVRSPRSTLTLRSVLNISTDYTPGQLC